MRKYSNEPKKKEKTAKAFGKELNVSWKKCNEVCYNIKGRKINNAIKLLKEVEAKKTHITYRRYNKAAGHRKGGQPGGYPVKAAKMIINLLNNLKANSEHKDLDTEKMMITHATAYKAIELQRTKPKGRIHGGHNIELTNIELVAKEM